MRQVVNTLPAAPGVYRFVDERGRALYVGRAVDLRRRVASYWGDCATAPDCVAWCNESAALTRWCATRPTLTDRLSEPPMREPGIGRDDDLSIDR